ncbi:MAG: methyltransferase [Acidimicrobiales bacterium]
MADLVTPMAVRVAATLGVADHVARGIGTAGELASATGADAGALDRLLGHLVTVGVLRREAADRYALTDLGEALRDDHPAGVRAVLDIDGALGRGDLSLVHLLHSLRTGDPCFPALYGRGFWDDVAADPERTAGYDACMGADVSAWAPAVVAALDWGRFDHVVDVGGGDGTLLAALLRAHPNARGTVFDQPATAAAAGARLAAAGLADRTGAVGGSFFDPLPPGGDAYVLCAVLHDWDDEVAAAILSRCAEAAGRGTVVVVEKTGAGGESPNTTMDLRVLAYFGGRERAVPDLRRLAERAGLGTRAVHQAGDLSIIELAAP